MRYICLVPFSHLQSENVKCALKADKQKETEIKSEKNRSHLLTTILQTISSLMCKGINRPYQRKARPLSIRAHSAYDVQMCSARVSDHKRGRLLTRCCTRKEWRRRGKVGAMGERERERHIQVGRMNGECRRRVWEVDKLCAFSSVWVFVLCVCLCLVGECTHDTLSLYVCVCVCV